MQLGETYVKRSSSLFWNIALATGCSIVFRYRALAESLPPLARVPNCPRGIKRGTLLDPV
jgi:hypothetical protein